LNLVQTGFSLQLVGVRIGFLLSLLRGAAGVFILWYGGHRVMEGALTIGDLMLFNTLTAYMLNPVQRLTTVNLQVQEALVALDRLYQIMDLELEENNTAQKVEFQRVRESISLRDLDFKYGCRSKVLDGICLEIPVGKTIALVGESGSGKSTLLKLLLRYYEPTEGSLSIDGVDLRDYSLESLRNRIGVVSQDPFIFNGTIRENVAAGRKDASLEEIIAATRSAGLEEFISGLPERYETMIGERGANLSGGQRQRLAIARALVRQPEIVIFDEATSHLDTMTESAIQRNLESAFNGKTVILVAHRLSTVRRADRIYVLHAGRIVQEGTHDELIRVVGRYQQLWNAQIGILDDASSDAADRPERPKRRNQAGVFESQFEPLAASGSWTQERVAS
jgi:ATP-binding cassette subfamily B protein